MEIVAHQHALLNHLLSCVECHLEFAIQQNIVLVPTHLVLLTLAQLLYVGLLWMVVM